MRNSVLPLLACCGLLPADCSGQSGQRQPWILTTGTTGTNDGINNLKGIRYLPGMRNFDEEQTAA